MDRASPTTAERAAIAPATREPIPWVTHEPRTVWRAWRIIPDHRSFDAGLMLAGLFGFPWPSAEVDARCTIQDRAGGSSPLHRQWVDRHHLVVPDADCTCGIYATDDELAQSSIAVAPRGQPLATGFVELSGRTLVVPGAIRAQHARIVGPLSILAGLPSLLGSWTTRLGWGARPQRVIAERDRFRVAWTRATAGEPIDEWRRSAAAILGERYGVSVIAVDSP